MDFYDCLCVCLLYIQLGTAMDIDCSNAFTSSNIKLPSKRQALTLDNFNKYVVGKDMTVLYYIEETDDDERPATNIGARFEKMENTLYSFNLNVRIVVPDACGPSEEGADLQPMVDCNKAVLYNQDSGRKIVLWSRCPSEYVFVFLCKHLEDAREARECPVTSTVILILLPGNPADVSLDNVPMFDIVRELKKTTGIKLGSGPFAWLFTVGDTECDTEAKLKQEEDQPVPISARLLRR